MHVLAEQFFSILASSIALVSHPDRFLLILMLMQSAPAGRIWKEEDETRELTGESGIEIKATGENRSLQCLYNCIVMFMEM